MEIDALFDRYDRGELSRRELALAITGLLSGLGGMAGAAALPRRQSTFQAIGLNHIALQVTDVARSKAFYERHLGLRTTSESSSSAFLDCGPQFVALFRSQEPGLAHYSYSIPSYSQSDAAERLRAVDIEPKLRGQRIYFDDPDGIEVQLSQG
ncbi:MAG TPA: VOC family protein [Thermoanaerobaculia bacterium]|nr:VOC family protein [Thermoanaerobaculia bacterium]